MHESRIEIWDKPRCYHLVYFCVNFLSEVWLTWKTSHATIIWFVYAWICELWQNHVKLRRYHLLWPYLSLDKAFVKVVDVELSLVPTESRLIAAIFVVEGYYIWVSLRASISCSIYTMTQGQDLQWISKYSLEDHFPQYWQLPSFIQSCELFCKEGILDLDVSHSIYK